MTVTNVVLGAAACALTADAELDPVSLFATLIKSAACSPESATCFSRDEPRGHSQRKCLIEVKGTMPTPRANAVLMRRGYSHWTETTESSIPSECGPTIGPWNHTGLFAFIRGGWQSTRDFEIMSRMILLIRQAKLASDSERQRGMSLGYVPSPRFRTRQPANAPLAASG
jgi:hypothetical protein